MQNKKGRANPNEKKIKQAEMLAELIGKYKICGMLNLYKMPARSFQKIKRDLSERAVIKVAKSAVLVKALETAGKKELAKIIAPQPAIILTNENPFKIFSAISPTVEFGLMITGLGDFSFPGSFVKILMLSKLLNIFSFNSSIFCFVFVEIKIKLYFFD